MPTLNPSYIERLHNKLQSQIERAESFARSSKSFTESNYWKSYADILNHRLLVTAHLLGSPDVDDMSIVTGMKDFDTNVLFDWLL